jgi:hypothetical protein
MFSAPLAVTYVYALAWHNEDSRLACLILGAALLAAWLFYLGITRKRDLPPRIVPVAVQTLAYVAGIVGMILINRYLYWTVTAEDGSAKIAPLAWPWHIPLSSVVAVVFGYILGHRKAPEGAAAGSNR